MNNLTRKQEPLYAFASFGSIFINLFLSVYIVNGLEGRGMVSFYGTDLNNNPIVYVSVFSILLMVNKIIDALSNVPLSSLCDNMSNRWGRRPFIGIGCVGMFILFVLMCMPLSLDITWTNTFIYISLILLFYGCYIVSVMSLNATYAEITADVGSRSRLTKWKGAFDTIAYSICYALFPLIFGMLGNNVNLGGLSINELSFVGLCISPIVFTLLIPLFVIKEPKSFLFWRNEKKKEQKTTKEYESSFWKGLKNVFTNANFVWWIIIFGVFYFALDLFLMAQTGIATNNMGLNGWQISVLNSAAFAPIPIMLILSNWITKRFGFKWNFLLSVATFATAMTIMLFSYTRWIGDKPMITLIMGSFAGTIGSYGISFFFSSPYFIPAQIAREEAEKKKKINSGMFFGAQGIVIALTGALNEPVWGIVGGIGLLPDKSTYDPNALEIGPHIILYIVINVCVVVLIAIFFMPKYFSEVGKYKVNKK